MPWLQHVVKHSPLPLLTPYLLCSLWQSPHQCGVHIGLYTLSSRRGFCIGYRIAKGVSERCIARLLLTLGCPHMRWKFPHYSYDYCLVFYNKNLDIKSSNFNKTSNVRLTYVSCLNFQF